MTKRQAHSSLNCILSKSERDLCPAAGCSQLSYSRGKLEDIEDELLHLDAIGRFWLNSVAAIVHVGDLLFGHMVLQLSLLGFTAKVNHVPAMNAL